MRPKPEKPHPFKLRNAALRHGVCRALPPSAPYCVCPPARSPSRTVSVVRSPRVEYVRTPNKRPRIGSLL